MTDPIADAIAALDELADVAELMLRKVSHAEAVPIQAKISRAREVRSALLSAQGQAPVRCAGCGSHWTDADLARERIAFPATIACCPEREPLTIDQWAKRAETARFPKDQG